MDLEELFVSHEFTVGAGGTCYRCGRPIDKSGRYTREWYGCDPGSDTIYRDTRVVEHFHPDCILEVAPQALRDVLGKSRGKYSDQARLKAALAAKLARMAPPPAKRQKGASSKKSAPGKSKKNAPGPIALERDRQGRPRVRVLVYASDDDTYPLREHFDAHNDPSTRLMRVTSKKREYTFLKFEEPLGPWEVSIEEAEPWHASQDDPAMPVLGAVVMSLYRGDGFGLLRPQLSTWRAFGLPVPLLWFPEGDATKQDKGEADARRRLEEGGFDGAKAPVLVTQKVDKNSLAKLAARLDDYLPDDAGNDGRSLFRRQIDTLRELVAEGRLAGTQPILKWLQDRRNYDKKPLKLSQPTLEAIARCAAHDELDQLALGLLAATRLPIAKVTARARAIQQLSGRAPTFTRSALEMLRGDDDPALTRAAIRALTGVADYMLHDLRAFLRSNKHPKKIAMIRERLAELPERTPNRKRLADYLATSKPKKR